MFEVSIIIPRCLTSFISSTLSILIAYEKAVEQQLVRTEISQAKRENKHYLSNVDKGKEISAIVERKRKHGASEEQVMFDKQVAFFVELFRPHKVEPWFHY